jgi:hypothetical protein
VAFAQFEEITETIVASMSTNHAINWPATTDAGDLCVMVFVASADGSDGATSITDPTDWTEKRDRQYSVGGDVRQHTWIGAIELTGSESGTFNVATNVGLSGVAQIYRYAAGTHGGVDGVEVSSHVEAEAANPDPPSLSPSWGAADTSWIEVITFEDSDFVVTAASSSYTGLETTIADTTEDATLSTARRENNTATEDPGATTADSEKYQAFLIAIEPGGGASTDTVSLFPTADGTDTDVVDEGDATSDLFASIDDDPASPSDSDWNNNTDDAGQAFYELTDMPGDFDSADSATITVRYRGAAYDGTGTVTLFARLYQSNESTALSDEVQVAQVTADGSFANTSPVTITGIVASDKTTWDGARLRLRWART